MKKKEALRIKLIRRFYGINGDYDEYKEKEINRIGNNAFMILFWYLIISNFLVCLFAIEYPVETLWTYLVLNMFVLLFVILPYIIFASRKRKLTEVEVEKKELKQAKKEAILGSINSGIFFGVGMYFLNGLIGVFIEYRSFIHFLANFRHVITSILAGLFFGSFALVVNLLRLHKIDSDKKD